MAMAKDAVAKPPHHLGKVIFAVVFISIAAGTFFIVHGQVLNALSPSPGIVGPQFWDLTNDAGQTATVLINPFTNSGTFGETADSAGWWVSIPGVDPIRLHVGGNIVHTNGGDRWEFVGLTAEGYSDGVSILYSATGTANGQFPYATYVSGSVSGTITSPMGTQSVNATWTGVKWGSR